MNPQGDDGDHNDPEYWLRRGLALGQAGRYAEAIAAFDRGLEIDPNNDTLWVGRATALSELGRHEESLAAYNRALKIDSNNALLWHGLGNTLLVLMFYEKALAAYDRGLEIGPNMVALWHGRGNTLLALNRHEEALETYDRALEIDSNVACLWLGRGNALGRLVRHGEALEACDRGLAITSKIAHLWSGRGNALSGLDRHAEALEAYDHGLEIDPFLEAIWLQLALVLAKHPEVDGQDATRSAQRCLLRYFCITEERSWQRARDARFVLDHLDLPLLLHRFLLEHPAIGTMLSRRRLLVANERRLAPIHTVLDWLCSDTCDLPEADRLLLRGRTEFHFGDPPAAYVTLDKLDDLDPSNLTGQLYLAWAMQECLCESSAQIDCGADLARSAMDHGDAPARTCFDAGHLLFLADDVTGAAEAFERPATTLFPARAMAAHCRRVLGDDAAAQAHVDQFLAEEEQRLTQGRRGLLVPVDLPVDCPTTQDGRRALEEVFHRFECAEAIHAWRVEGVLDAHPVYQALVERLGGGLDEWISEYEHRMERWGELYADRDELKRSREKRHRTWIESQRSRLSGELDWLGSERPALSGEALIKKIAIRVYDASELPDPQRVIDAIYLLFVEHRLPADFTLMLMHYCGCKATELHKHRLGDVKLAAKYGLTLLFGTSIRLFGVEHALEIFAIVNATGLAADMTAERLGHWLAERRRNNQPFPRFERFRVEFLEYLERY